MIGFEIPLILAAGAAWDIGRRWVEREHTADANAAEALDIAELAATRIATFQGTLDTHAIGISKLEKRAAAVGESVRYLKEAKTTRARPTSSPLTGARRGR